MLLAGTLRLWIVVCVSRREVMGRAVMRKIRISVSCRLKVVLGRVVKVLSVISVSVSALVPAVVRRCDSVLGSAMIF